MAVKFEATDYKKITLDEMMDFIEANYGRCTGFLQIG